ncbi:exported hypothetical protein [Pseudomonas serboccidentalis]
MQRLPHQKLCAIAVGVSLLAIAVCQATGMLADTPQSRAGSLLQILKALWRNSAARYRFT